VCVCVCVWCGGADGDGSGNVAERLSCQLDAQPLGNYVWLHFPAASGSVGGGGVVRCALLRRKVLRSLGGEAALAAKVESFSDYFDRRIRPPADLAALRWACEAVGLPADTLDGPLDAGVHAVLNLFDLVTLQRMPSKDALAEVLPTLQVLSPFPRPSPHGRFVALYRV
jgi:hypothetical protein